MIPKRRPYSRHAFLPQRQVSTVADFHPKRCPIYLLHILIVIVMLTVYRQWATSERRFRIPRLGSPTIHSPRSPTVKTVYRDGKPPMYPSKYGANEHCAGLFYYIILLMVSIVNLCVTTLESVSSSEKYAADYLTNDIVQPAGSSMIQLCVPLLIHGDSLILIYLAYLFN